MNFESLGQEIVVMDESPEENIVLEPIPMELTEYGNNETPVINVENADIEIVVSELPGVPDDIEIDPLDDVGNEDKEDKEEDKNDAQSSSKGKWDWESKGPDGFFQWIKETIDNVPKHSGSDLAGIERAQAYFERLDTEISKAMRQDLDGELDANKIENIRKQIDEGLHRLQIRSEKLKKLKKFQKKTKKAFQNENLIVKEGQKITGVQGVYVTVPLLISRIARNCINSYVSAGHDIEKVYEQQSKLYKLSMREQAEVLQLLDDMGYPVRLDRGFMSEDQLEVTEHGNDWMANYHS